VTSGETSSASFPIIVFLHPIEAAASHDLPLRGRYYYRGSGSKLNRWALRAGIRDPWSGIRGPGSANTRNT
jgi:fermentation-respiration switch protein FrsA (DUF1100 family)